MRQHSEKTRGRLITLAFTSLMLVLYPACPKKRSGSTAEPPPPRAEEGALAWLAPQRRAPSLPPVSTARNWKLTWDVEVFKAGQVTVIHRSTPGKPVVAVRIYIQGGCQNLSKRTAGIEELMLSTLELGGSAGFPMDKLARTKYSKGIQIVSGTGQDYSVVGSKCVKEHFDKAWEILTDITLKPSLSGRALEIQRQRQLKEIQTRQDSPNSQISVAAEQFYFAGHPYALLQEGSEENVRRFTSADLAAYHGKALKGDRLLVVVVGDLDREDLKRKASKAFGGLSASSKPFVAVSFPTHGKPRLKVIPRDLPTNFVIGYFAAPPPGHPDYAPLKVGLSILSDTLFREIRTKRRLSYAVATGLAARRANVGYVYLFSRQPNKAVAVALKEMKKMAAKKVPRQELNDNLQVFLTHNLMRLQTQSAQARLLGRAVLVAGDWRWAEGHLSDLQKVTPEAIQKVMSRYCKNLQFVLLGPAKVNRSVFTSL